MFVLRFLDRALLNGWRPGSISPGEWIFITPLVRRWRMFSNLAVYWDCLPRTDSCSFGPAQSLRQLLRVEFDLEAIYDLGDTKLFDAAVLPVIVVARKRTSKAKQRPCTFDRVYECRSSVQDTVSEQEYPSILDALRDRQREGVVRAQGNVFCIERGTLLAANHDAVWSLSNPEYEDWLQAVGERTHCSFGDVGQVRVGIKTTADRVFVREDWESLPPRIRPESDLLRPLITHLDAGRWVATRPLGRPVCFIPTKYAKANDIPSTWQHFRVPDRISSRTRTDCVGENTFSMREDGGTRFGFLTIHPTGQSPELSFPTSRSSQGSSSTPVRPSSTATAIGSL